MPTPSLHAVLSPSSSSRWLACPPSARLCERLDTRFGAKSSVFAEEGTRAHALGEAKIRNAVYHADNMSVSKVSRMSEADRASYIGINDFRFRALVKELGDITPAVEQATDSYCDVVMDKYLSARERDPSTKLFLEQRVDISEWVPGCFGSSDCILISDSLLEVMDYKNGKGIPVSATGNSQLRLYALGAYALFRRSRKFTAVRYTIIQPQLNSVSDETLPVEDLLHWAETEVSPVAKLAWTGRGEFLPGEHCRFCSAKAVCAARVSEALKFFQYGLESPGLISDEQILGVLPTLDLAEAWIKDIRAYVQTQAQHGQVFPGYKLVRGKRPNRQWADPEEVKAQLLRAGFPASVFESTSLNPIGEVEKAIGKPAFKALLSDCVMQGDGALILVPESDKRVAYSSADADFSDLTQDDDETSI